MSDETPPRLCEDINPVIGRRVKGLDVERLARALTPFTRAVLHDDIEKWRRETAGAIAREYAALSDTAETGGLDYGESRETLTTDEMQARSTAGEVARFELVERYIRALQWSVDVPETVRTIVAGNLCAFARWLSDTAETGGTTTDCPLTGVHEHAFRGPHRFREWEPGAVEDETPPRLCEDINPEEPRCTFPGCTCGGTMPRISTDAILAQPGPRETGLRKRIEAVVAEHADADAENTHWGGDALLADIRRALSDTAETGREPDPWWTPCRKDLRCYRNDGHDGPHAYPTGASDE